MKVEAVKTHSGTVARALEAAHSECEPVLVNAVVHADDRGWSIMNQFRGVMTEAGQINYSLMYPNVVKAWHRHRNQTDLWLCVLGHLKVGIHREDGRTWQAVIGEMRPSVVIIPSTLWHGAATVGAGPAGLLYYVTHQFNADDPDEERKSYDSIAGFPWSVQHK